MLPHTPEPLREGKRNMRFTIGRANIVGALVALTAVSLAPPLAAQQASLTGTVTDPASAQPLAGVRITVVGTNRAVFTNQDGRYTITAVPSGTQRLLAALIGYGALTQTVTVPADGSVTLNFALKVS